MLNSNRKALGRGIRVRDRKAARQSLSCFLTVATAQALSWSFYEMAHSIRSDIGNRSDT